MADNLKSCYAVETFHEDIRERRLVEAVVTADA
jgi:hypothetical protein